MKIAEKFSVSRFLTVLFAATLLAHAAPAKAVVVVDQEVDLSSSGFNDLDTLQWQSFMQASGNIAGAAVRIDSTDSNGNPLSGSITLSILDGAPDGGGNVLASGTALAASATPAPDDERWFTVFWSPVAVIPETELFLNVTNDNNLISLVSINNSPYLRGTQFLDGTPSSGGGKKKGKNADLAFRTYAETSSTEIPEPGATALLSLSAALLIIGRRRYSGNRRR